MTSAAQLGYRMPAEWEPHRGTWLSWPHKEASWPGKFGPVPAIFARMVRHLADQEEVHINVAGPEMEQDVRATPGRHRADSGNVFFHYHPTNDAWCRDHGPIFLQRHQGGGSDEAIVDWDYNAWGGKYPPYDLDDVIPTRIAKELGLPVFHPGIVMEGGSIDVNGGARCSPPRLACSTPTAILTSTAAPSRTICAATSACPTSCGSAMGSQATTPTATWMT